jgi:hypothetical protein
LAIETTRRRFDSIIVRFASTSPRSIRFVSATSWAADQERVSTGVAQEELERVGGRFRHRRERCRPFVLDHLDAVLLELAADGVELERIALELIEDLRHRPPLERVELLRGLEQQLPLLARKGMRLP